MTPLPGQHVSNVKHSKQSVYRVVLIITGVLLLFLGSGRIALATIGKPVKAQVTQIEQVLFIYDDNSTRNPSRYRLDYRFSLDGRTYSGSVTRVFQAGSHMRQTLPVLYLPMWPSINTEDQPVDPSGPILLGTGVLLLFLSFRRAKTVQH